MAEHMRDTLVVDALQMALVRRQPAAGVSTDQIAYRKAKGRAGGGPPSFDRDLYRDRNVVERAFKERDQGEASLPVWSGRRRRCACGQQTSVWQTVKGFSRHRPVLGPRVQP